VIGYDRGVIDVLEFDWLDFNISHEKTIKLFREGADAAAEFLRTFDGKEYKTKRADYRNGIVQATAAFKSQLMPTA
jgi:hypothetical protein